MAKRSKEPSVARMYMHDTLIPGIGAIVSTACEGPECLICAGDPAAAKRAGNRYFPWEPPVTKEDQEGGAG